MRASHGLAICVVVLSLGSQAQAARWIVKNPARDLTALKTRGGVRQVLAFGGNRFVVVDTATKMGARSVTALASEKASLAADLDAEFVTLDFPIGLADAATPVSTAGGERAWHVDALHYGQLPADTTGQGVIVAVLDTGVDATHAALADAMWTNAGEIAGNGIDDDANGFVDDVHGYSFARQSGDSSDSAEHGTHCAGIIAAAPESAAEAAARGVAPGVKIMSVHIIQRASETFLSDAAAGIKYAVDNGARVLSNSWRVYKSWDGYVPNDEAVALLRDAITYAEQHGVIFVAAAGNETVNIDTTTDPIYPVGMTELPLMVGVAASTEGAGKAGFTNVGATRVHVAAPGNEIISTLPGSHWGAMSGTSMATPLVSGALARGLSAGYSPELAISKMVDTSVAGDVWTGMVVAGGVVDLMAYLAH